MKIKIAVFKLNLKDGGGSNLVLDLKARALQARGHDVSVITLFSQDNKLPAGLPYKVFEEDISPYGLFSTPRKIAGVFKKFAAQSDIFFCEGASLLWGAGFYRKFLGNVPVAVNLSSYPLLVENVFNKPPLFPEILPLAKKARHKLRIVLERWLGLWLAREIDLFIASTRKSASLYAQAGFKQDKFKVIPDFIDVERLMEYNIGPCPAELSTNHFHILYSGRLAFGKGPDILIRAFAVLGDSEKCRLHIVGSGPEKEALEKMAIEAGVARAVIFYPWMAREQLFSFYKYSHLFVHPGRWPEAFGLVAIEAMAFGLPCVVTADSSPAEVVDGSGLVFEKGNANDLSRKIDLLRQDSRLREDLSKKAAICSGEFDYRKHITELEEALAVL
ncbi:MAG: glycosyltransferase family 4 protein [Patescibacteria group bacterium]